MAESSTDLGDDRGRRLIITLNATALVTAAIAAAGSVYLSLGLGLKACPLCFYQRSFAFAAVLTLAMSFWLDGVKSSRARFVTIPVAASGLALAAFHFYLVRA